MVCLITTWPMQTICDWWQGYCCVNLIARVKKMRGMCWSKQAAKRTKNHKWKVSDLMLTFAVLEAEHAHHWASLHISHICMLCLLANFSNLRWIIEHGGLCQGELSSHNAYVRCLQQTKWMLSCYHGELNLHHQVWFALCCIESITALLHSTPCVSSLSETCGTCFAIAGCSMKIWRVEWLHCRLACGSRVCGNSCFVMGLAAGNTDPNEGKQKVVEVGNFSFLILHKVFNHTWWPVGQENILWHLWLCIRTSEAESKTRHLARCLAVGSVISCSQGHRFENET